MENMTTDSDITEDLFLAFKYSYYFISAMSYPFKILRNVSCAIASITILFSSTSVLAAERVVLTYNIWRESVSVEELTQFAETGEASPTINYYLRQTNQDPHTFRNVLNQPINVSPVLLDRTLNSRVGEFLLDRISQTIRTPSGLTNRQALRSAIVLSASQGNQVSLIEIIQNYPTQEVHVEGDRLASTYNQVNILVQGLQNFLNNLDPS